MHLPRHRGAEGDWKGRCCKNSGTRCSYTTAAEGALIDGNLGNEKTKEPITNSMVMTKGIFKCQGTGRRYILEQTGIINNLYGVAI